MTDANRSRKARDKLRAQYPDGGVHPVTDNQGRRRFTWGRYTSAFNAPVSVLRISFRISGISHFDPAVVDAFIQRAQFALDLHFNNSGQLSFGDRMMADLVPATGSELPDMTIDLDPNNPDGVSPIADLDMLVELLRQQVGLTGNGESGLTSHDLENLGGTHPLDPQSTATTTIPITPSLSPELQQIFDIGLDTPAGRAYYAPSDTRLRNSALSLSPTPGRYTLDLHGSPQSASVDGTSLSAADLAALVRADPNWNGEPIHLFSCNTGQESDGFAQQLATELGVDVYAPTELAWGYPDGSSVVSSGYTDSNNQTWPRIPPDGTWQLFNP
ncbi:hypothetical protein ACTWPB_04050 [Nocardia sp. IBHARD005]|uniref:hypothetical protein n=1 Tax=Nocardia sp. IBHARD005 TaxID=3457765 RepID=UPI004059A29E